MGKHHLLGIIIVIVIALSFMMASCAAPEPAQNQVMPEKKDKVEISDDLTKMVLWDVLDYNITAEDAEKLTVKIQRMTEEGEWRPVTTQTMKFVKGEGKILIGYTPEEGGGVKILDAEGNMKYEMELPKSRVRYGTTGSRGLTEEKGYDIKDGVCWALFASNKEPEGKGISLDDGDANENFGKKDSILKNNGMISVSLEFSKGPSIGSIGRTNAAVTEHMKSFPSGIDELAESGAYTLDEQGRVIGGKDVWAKFYERVKQGKYAEIDIVKYTEDEGGPFLIFLSYNGGDFYAVQDRSRVQPTETSKEKNRWKVWTEEDKNKPTYEKFRYTHLQQFDEMKQGDKLHYAILTEENHESYGALSWRERLMGDGIAYELFCAVDGIILDDEDIETETDAGASTDADEGADTGTDAGAEANQNQ